MELLSFVTAETAESKSGSRAQQKEQCITGTCKVAADIACQWHHGNSNNI